MWPRWRARCEGLLGAGCTTDTPAHHRVSIALLDYGLHTLCEKPLALTIRSCDLIIAAAKRNGKILSVAENFRRDPINRLVRALLDDKAIGERQFIMETSIWGQERHVHHPLASHETGRRGDPRCRRPQCRHSAILFRRARRPRLGQTRLFEKPGAIAAPEPARAASGKRGPSDFPEVIDADRRGRHVRHPQLRRTARSASGCFTTPATVCPFITAWCLAPRAR